MQKEGVKSELVIKDGCHGPGVMIDMYFDKMIAFLRMR